MAQVSLGLQYAKGQGVSKDLVQAYKWIALAEPNLPQEFFVLLSGVSLLTEVKKLMTPSEVLLGNRLVEEFEPKREWEPEKHKKGQK
jgi:hypothetical protein